MAKLKKYINWYFITLISFIFILTPKLVIGSEDICEVARQSYKTEYLDKFEQLLKKRNTILFVTHGMGDARKLCSRALYLNKGEQKGFGPVDEIHRKYLADMER